MSLTHSLTYFINYISLSPKDLLNKKKRTGKEHRLGHNSLNFPTAFDAIATKLVVANFHDHVLLRRNHSSPVRH